MSSSFWPRITIYLNGKNNLSIAPVIISASRATDIPAFYTKQLIECLRRGYLFWTNPFNGCKSLISLENTKLIVFWSKNPAPLIQYLDEIKHMGIDFYFNYTLNDYENEGFENILPNLDNRLNTFIKLSEKIGHDKVIWRFDPVIASNSLDIYTIIGKIEKLAVKLNNYTGKLVFSFVDTHYKKVQINFKKWNPSFKNMSNENKVLFAEKLAEKLKSYAMQISTCAEEEDFSQFGITSNKCIDDELISNNFADNSKLMEFINSLKSKNQLKDKGQRKFCACIPSKDIGRYNSCGYSCLYCYATKQGTSLQSKIFE